MLAGSIDGGSPFLATDNSVAPPNPDVNPAVGVLTLLPFGVGGIDFGPSTQTATVAAAFGQNNILSSSGLTITNSDSVEHTVILTIGATDFFGPASTARTSGSGTWVNAGGSSVTMNWYNDAGNTQGADNATDTPGILIDTFSASAVDNPTSFAHDGGPFVVSDPGPFSMTLQVNLTLAPGAQVISYGLAEVKPAIPEPSTLALFGCMGALLLAWKRLRLSV